MFLSQKIKNLRKNELDLSQEEFAQKLDISTKTVSYWESGKNEPNKSNLLSICNEFNLPTDYFEKKVKKVINILPDTENYITLTYRPNVYLSAGYGVEVLDERAETMLIDACLLVSERGIKYNPKQCEIVRISGNSMSPEYRHGDRVIINKGDTELMDGHIFAFRYKNQCYVKEINLMGDRVKCISLNKEYEPFYINEGEDFTVFGRILPRIRL